MKFFLLLVVAIVPFAVIAQPNYHQGYVVKNNGDTLKGFINYREWLYSPESVEFKAIMTSPALKFTADSVKGFGVTGFETYRSFTGDITFNKNIFPNIPFGIDTSHGVRSIFLRKIKSGQNLDLYYNNEVNKDRFFISERNGIPVELKYYSYYTSASTEAYGNVYKTQLQLMATKYGKNSSQITNDLEDAKYDVASISELVDEINGTVSQKSYSAQSAGNQPHVRFIAGIAGIYSTNSSPTTTTFTPKFNAGADFLFNPQVQQVILRVELGYTWTNGYYPALVQTEYGIATVNQSFTQYSFSVTPQLIYNVYNTDSFKVYVDGGPALNFASYSGQFGLTPFWVSFPLQAGMVFNRRWEVFVSYSFRSDYLGASYYNTNQSDGVGIKHLF